MSLPHEKSTNLIASCAKAFHVEVEPFDNNKWSAGLTMAKALDTLVDDDHIYDTGIYAEELLTGETVPHVTHEEAAFIRKTYDALSEPSQERWRNSASQLGAFAIKRLEAESVGEYVDVVYEESYLMSEVLKVENDEANRDHAQRASFNSWMSQMGRTAYLCDTLSDFIKDYNEGNVNVQPTPRTAAVIAGYALKELVAFSRVTPAPVYVALARRSVTKTIEKAQRPGFWSKQFVLQDT